MAGYTIIEVLVFLAVSGMLAVSAMLYVNGQQQRTEFDTGVRDFASKLEDITNDISTGYYAYGGKFKCVASPNAQPNLTGGGATQKEGENSDCVYVGDVLHFAPSGTNKRSMNIYGVAGNRLTSSGREATCVTDAILGCAGQGTFPILIANGAAPECSGAPPPWCRNVGGPDFTDSYDLRGVTINLVTYNDGAVHTTGAFGFFTSFGNYSGANLISGSVVQSKLAAIKTNLAYAGLDKDKRGMVAAIDDALNTAGGYIQNPTNVRVCLDQDGTGRAALITINGGSSSRTDVEFFKDTAAAKLKYPGVCA
jgi:hypothetical protein